MSRILRTLFYAFLIMLLFGAGLGAGLLAAQRGLLGLLGIGESTINITLVLEQVQNLAELTTTRYNFSSVVTSERDMPPLLRAIYGDRQLLFAVGYIEAGIDLDELDETDFVITDTTLAVVLPGATLQSCALDENNTYVMERETGIFAPQAANLDSDARRYAIAQFRDQALENGILQEAETEARIVIEQLLLASNPSLQEISIRFAPATANATLPENCR